MGWADETLGFYALLIPLMLALGYDRMAAAGMIIASTTVGSMASTVNPFSIGVASEFADVGIGDGIGLLLVASVAVGVATGFGEKEITGNIARGFGHSSARPSPSSSPVA